MISARFRALLNDGDANGSDDGNDASDDDADASSDQMASAD